MWGDGGERRRVKVNLLSLYQTIVGPLLVSRNPRYLVNTFDLNAAASVRIEQDWLNEHVIHVNLAQVGLTCVHDAFYSTGIAKVALASPCDAAVQAWGITAGEPTVRAIDLDDFVYDLGAKEFGEAEFIGHKYRCPLDVAKKLYKKTKGLEEEDPKDYDEQGNPLIGTLFRGSYSIQEFEPHVTLWEIYLPRHKAVCTFADHDIQTASPDGKVKPLWTQNWVGPPWGPYHFLRFGRVPGTALGKGPFMDLYELHMDANNVHRKANNQLRRLKELTFFPRQNDIDAKAIQDSNDGDLVPVQDPDRIKPYISGGAALQGLLLAADNYKNLFSFVGGNLELLGGRAAQSKTATQDKLLNANAGGGIEAMHGHVEDFFAGVGESLLWYAHYHPELVMKAEYKVPGAAPALRELYPAESPQEPRRDYPFHRAKLRIQPYSLRHKSPGEILAFVASTVNQFTPMLPLLQQQGIAMDANRLMDIFAEYGDTPQLKEVFTIQEPAGEGVGGSHERTLPTDTERTYTREGGQDQGPGAAQQLAEMSANAFQNTPQAAGTVR